MLRSKKQVRLIPLLFLIVMLGSLALLTVYVFAFLRTSSLHVEEKPYDVVSSKDILLSFSASKTSYIPGETAIFYIDVTNRRDYPFHQLNFSLEVKCLSLFDLNFYSMNGSSSRTFMPNKLERLRIFPKDAIEVTLPVYTPPGVFALELSAKSPGLKDPPKASIIININTPVLVMSYLGITSLISGIVYALLACARFRDAHAYVVLNESVNKIILGKIARFSYVLNSRSSDLELTFERIYKGFSTGQKIIFLGIFTLLWTPVPLILKLDNFANDLALLAYTSFVMGVINLFWEESKWGATRLHTVPRLILSLFFLGVLNFFSNRILGGLVFGIILYILIRHIFISGASSQPSD